MLFSLFVVWCSTRRECSTSGMSWLFAVFTASPRPARRVAVRLAPAGDRQRLTAGCGPRTATRPYIGYLVIPRTSRKTVRNRAFHVVVVIDLEQSVVGLCYNFHIVASDIQKCVLRLVTGLTEYMRPILPPRLVMSAGFYF